MCMSNVCVLLDTSFFIRLLNPADALHESAKEYYRYFLENDFVLKISTIAIAEFCVKGSVSMLPMRNLQVLPFNFDHGVKAGELCEIAFRKKTERGAVFPQRTIVPNDTKMFAQAEIESDVNYFVSADSEANKVYNMIGEEYKFHFDYIDISIPYTRRFAILF